MVLNVTRIEFVVSIQKYDVTSVFEHVSGDAWQTFNVHNMPVGILGDVFWKFEF